MREINSLTDVYRGIPAPVAVLAANVDGENHAMIVSSFVAISDDPGLVAVSIKTGSSSWKILRRTPELGISILTAEHEELTGSSWRLASNERLAETPVTFDGQAVHVASSPTILTCDIVDERTVGDHELVILSVRSALHEPNKGTPIVHHNHAVTELRSRIAAY